MAYTYEPEYDSYDPYVSRPLSRSMSRQRSIGHPGTSYPTSSYSDGVPVTNYHTAYQLYGHPSSALVPTSRRALGYNTQYHDGQMAMGRSLSRTPSTRSRRHSTVSFANYGYGVPSTMHIKFKRKGSFSSGIGLDEAQQHILKLSNNDSYSFHDLHADSHRRIHLKIKWTGYSALTYEIPLAGYDRVDLQTLARRISRACVHYLQANVIPVPWDRVILHHLEEVQYGIWQPMLSMR